MKIIRFFGASRHYPCEYWADSQEKRGTWKTEIYEFMDVPHFPREEFQSETEKGFVDDLILYLDYKIREAERIRTERKQLSFW